jgi:hypothetical protein
MSTAAYTPTEEDVNDYEALKAELLVQLRKGKTKQPYQPFVPLL